MDNLETKTSQAITLFRNGCHKEALAIFVTFKVGFTKDEKRTLQIAYETLLGHGLFYAQLSIDIQLEVEKSKEIINKKYTSNENT